MSGTFLQVLISSENLSKIEAVVAAEYCGNIGIMTSLLTLLSRKFFSAA